MTPPGQAAKGVINIYSWHYIRSSLMNEHLSCFVYYTGHSSWKIKQYKIVQYNDFYKEIGMSSMGDRKLKSQQKWQKENQRPSS